MRKSGKRSIFKPDYDGPREAEVRMPGQGAAIPEEGAFALLERRIHRAMLTLDQVRVDGHYSKGTFWPSYVVDFADRIEQEEATEAPRRRFKPTPADVSDMLDALGFLEGLRPEYFQLVRHKARGDFYLDAGAAWTDLGEAFGRSDYWAREAYGRAMSQAARRAGLIFTAPVQEAYAVLTITVMLDGVLVTWLGTSSDPKQTLYDLRAKNPADIVDAIAVWVENRGMAKTVLASVKADFAAAIKRGNWYHLDPFDADTAVVSRADRMGAAWRMEYLTGEPLEAPVRLVIEEPEAQPALAVETGS